MTIKLVERLQHDEPAVIIAAADTLAALEPMSKEVAEALAELLQDPRRKVRRRVRESLESMDREVSDALLNP